MKTIISPKLLKFMFISNLAEWHYSCRNSFNDVWKNYPQPLTTEDENPGVRATCTEDPEGAVMRWSHYLL